MVKKTFLFLYLIALISNSLFSQEMVILQPNFALSTHPITVDKIVLSDSSIKVTLTVTNHVKGGEFCAGEMMYIQELKRKKKAFLLKSTGIPTCPQTYRFVKPGDQLTFELEFFGLYEIPAYINIVEDCLENCFTIYGVILDTEMNHDIDMGFSLYKAGSPELSAASFEKAVNNHPDYPFGYLYEYIIDLYAEMGNYEMAGQWYQKLKSSEFVDKDQVIEKIGRKSFFGQISVPDK